MTPEEAKPHVFRYAATQGQPGDVQLEKETGERMPIGTPFFTAKETAEIAKAYGHACVHAYLDSAADTIAKFDQLFDGWSK